MHPLTWPRRGLDSSRHAGSLSGIRVCSCRRLCAYLYSYWYVRRVARAISSFSHSTHVHIHITTRRNCRQLDEEKAEQFEEEHVHGVYNTISSHFSHTRYKPWPKVVEFLESLQDGSWVADVGCGNGAYVCVNLCVCMHVCINLIRCARPSVRMCAFVKGACVGDICGLSLIVCCWRQYRYDFSTTFVKT